METEKLNELEVEAVARAICLGDGMSPEKLSHNSFEWWRHYVPHARAAIRYFAALTPDPAVNVGALEYSDEKFTREELDRSFPDGVPLLFFKILFPEKSSPLTVGELRQIGRALTPPQSGKEGGAETPAEQPPAPQADVRVTDAMVEAAARAMCEAWYYAPIGTPDGDAEWDRKQDQYRKQAGAGLSAALAIGGRE